MTVPVLVCVPFLVLDTMPPSTCDFGQAHLQLPLLR